MGLSTGPVESCHNMMAVSLIPRFSDEVFGVKNNSELSGLGTVLCQASQQHLSSKVVSEYRRLILILLLLTVLFSVVK